MFLQEVSHCLSISYLRVGEAIPIAPFSLSSNSYPVVDLIEKMARSVHIQTGIPSLVVDTPKANNDWQC